MSMGRSLAFKALRGQVTLVLRPQQSGDSGGPIFATQRSVGKWAGFGCVSSGFQKLTAPKI